MKKNVFKIQSLICSATVLSGVLGMGSVSAGGAFSTMSHPEASAHTPEIFLEGDSADSTPAHSRISSEMSLSARESRDEWDFCLSRSVELLDKMNVMCASLLKGVFERNNMNCWSECSSRQTIEERIESAKRAYIGRADRYDVFCVLRVLLECMEKEKDKLSKDAIFCELYNFINSVFAEFKAVKYDIYLDDISSKMLLAGKRKRSFLEEKVHDLSTFYFRYKLVGASADER